MIMHAEYVSTKSSLESLRVVRYETGKVSSTKLREMYKPHVGVLKTEKSGLEIRFKTWTTGWIVDIIH